jgi:outer membrane biosynthesis protein TonB
MSPGLGGTAPRAPAPPGSSGYSLRQETTDRTAGGERPAAVKSTMLGMAKPVFVAPAKPGPEHDLPTATAPMLGRGAVPANDTAPAKSEGEAEARRKSRPELEPVRLDDDLLPRAKSTPELSNMGARGFRDRQKPPGRLDPMPQAAAQKPRSRPELKPVELPEEPVTVPPAAKASAVERTLGNVANVGLSAVQEEPSAQGRVMERVTFGDQPTDPSLQALPAALLEEARRPDMPPLVPAPPPRSSEKLDELKDMAGERPPPLDPDAAGRSEAITKPFDTSSLMAAIEEEQPFAGNEGAQQLLDAVVRKRVQEETLIVVRREQRKSRAVMLFVLFLVVVGEYFALRWFEENGHKNELAPAAGIAAPAKGTPSAAPAGTVAAPGAVAPGAVVAEPGQTPEQPPAEAAKPGTEPSKPTAEAAKRQPAPEAAKPAPEPAKPAAEAAKPAPEPAKPTAEAAERQPEEQALEPAAAATDVKAARTGAAGPAAGASSDSLVHDGTDLLNKGDAVSAKAYFLQASTVDAKNAHAFAGLAEAELVLGEHHNALQHIEQAIKLRPRRARYRVTQGDVLKALGKPDEALAAYRKALEIDPEDREAKRRLGE